MRAALLEPMPPMERDTALDDGAAAIVNGEASNGAAAASGGGGDGVNLLGDLGGTSGGGGLLDIVVGDPSSTTATSAQAPPSTGNDNSSLLDLLGGLDLSSGEAPAGGSVSQPQSFVGGLPMQIPLPATNGNSLDPLGGILGGGGSVVPSNPAVGLDDLLGGLGSGTTTTPAAAPVTTALPPLVFYDQNGLSVAMAFGEFGGGGPANMTLEAVNNNPSQVTEFTFQAAVPKSMQLELLTQNCQPTIEPAGGKVTLQMKVQNPQKVPIKMRVRLSYILGGAAKTFHEGEVSNFPPALWTM